MNVDFFDFQLPEENIALRPLADREAAKLLYVSHSSEIKDYCVKDLVNLVRPGDALVFNDTKVIPASLDGIRVRDTYKVPISVTLHKPLKEGCWRAFARPAKRLKAGDLLIFEKLDKCLKAQVLEKEEAGEIVLAFEKGDLPLEDLLYSIGTMPLPPYIASRRTKDEQDEKDYQTVFAKEAGAVAAPTAGLHFTESMLEKLAAAGVGIFFVTLHVGAGTFFPVKVEDTDDHKMHCEYGYISSQVAEALSDVKARGGRIICVGTTSLRVLETAAPAVGKITQWSGETDIFITPGYEFRFVDCLITNFHLPRSTLFMLVSAFSGLETMHKAYQHAIENNYRFYSYGDTSFLERKEWKET